MGGLPDRKSQQRIVYSVSLTRVSILQVTGCEECAASDLFVLFVG